MATEIKYNNINITRRNYLAQTDAVFRRAVQEGFPTPNDFNKQAMDDHIRAMIRTGVWDKLDSYHEFAFNNQGILRDTKAFEATTWSKVRATITANAVTAPDGTLTADKIVSDTTTGTHYMVSSPQPVTMSAGTVFTYSVYAKAAEVNRAYIQINSAAVAFPTAVFDLTGGTVTSVTAGLTASTQSVGSGWYRCIITYTVVNAGVQSFGNFIGINGSNGSTFLGNGVDGLYYWGAQLEYGSVATTLPVDLSKFSLINWKYPYGALATTIGGVTFTNSGWKGNGVDGYIDLAYQPGFMPTVDKFTAVSESIGGVVYDVTGSLYTSLSTSSNNWLGLNNSTSHKVNSVNNLSAAVDFTGIGFKLFVRDDITNVRLYNKGVESIRTQTASNPIVGSTAQAVHRRQANYGAAGASNIFWGGALTLTEYTNLRTAYNNYLLKIGLTAYA